MKIMISKFTPWTLETFKYSEHPEIVAIRNIVTHFDNAQFILIGEGGNKFGVLKTDRGRVVFYNLSLTKSKYVFSLITKFLLVVIHKPAIVVSMGASNLVPYGIACMVTRSKFIPVVTGELWYALSFYPRILREIIYLLLRALFSKSHIVLVLSKRIRLEIITEYKTNPEKVIIYRYKVSSIFNPNVSKELKKVLDISGKKVIFTNARIAPQKGLEYLIDAFKEVIEKVPDAILVIKAYSSDRKYEGKILRKITELNLKNRVMIIKRQVPYEDLPKYYAIADVFVLPSVSEALGVVLLEAMASGVPIVATNVGGITDIVIHEYNGLLVRPHDSQGLAEAILKVLINEDLRKKLIQNELVTIRKIKESENEFENLLRTIITDIMHSTQPRNKQ
jgi:glycosyltransferase involved in cell wall biosynthesis